MNQTSEAEVFTLNIKVTKADIDGLDHVNNIVYLKWVQNIAETHWKTRATKADQENSIWVVLSHFIEYKSPAFLGDLITLKTCVGETNGAKSFRHVEIYRQDKLLAKAKTQWCLLDMQTGRPKRITDELIDFFVK